MISYIVQRFVEDAITLFDWAKGNNQNEAQQAKIKKAAFRMLVTVGVTFVAVSSFSVITFIVTATLKIALKLAICVCVFALGHDVFITGKNLYNSRASVKENLYNTWTHIQKDLVALLNIDGMKGLFNETYIQMIWNKNNK
jgi:fatty-acid desaturase